MKPILSTLFALCTNILLSQINSFPYTESFEQTLNIGPNSEFIPNWSGNTVATRNRIFSGSDPRTGLKSLNIISTSNFQATIEISLDLSQTSNATISFYAFSKQNGSPLSNRPVLLCISTSTDGGTSYSQSTSIGDENSFPNNNSTSYTHYSYSLPAIANGKPDVIVRMVVERGNGLGSSAELVIDDLSIEGQGLGLIVSKLKVISPTEIEVTYNQPVEPSGAITLENYTLNFDLVPIHTRSSSDTTVTLKLNRPFVNNTYKLEVANVTSLNGSAISENSEYLFTYETTTLPRQIVINELFVDPDGEYRPFPTVLSADSKHEFVELYNNSPNAINIGDFDLSGGTIASFVLLPNRYVILTAIGSIEQFRSFGNVVGVSSWNSLSNNGERIVLQDNLGNVVDSLTYSKSWYQDVRKADGGWSIEQINPNPSCFNLYNWGSSVSHQGGTPGQWNSIYDLSPDNTTPEVLQLSLIGDSAIQIAFNEAMDVSSLQENNFSLSQDNSIDSLFVLNSLGTEVYVEFTTPFTRGFINTITLSNVKDCAGNVLEESSLSFHIGALPLVNELVITEIMANPAPSQGLPEAEYLEVYNSSDKIVSLEGLILADAIGSTTLSEFELLPNEYLILTANSSVDPFIPLGKVLGVRNWPSLNNQTDRISIYNPKGALIHSVEYFDIWYRSSGKAEGGYSLEMIDQEYPCLENSNWTASESLNGGTPGNQNSVWHINPDMVGPKILQAIALDNSAIKVTFSEKLNTSEIEVSNFSANLGLSFISLRIQNDRSLILITGQDLVENTVYQITADNITDCSGNLISIDNRTVDLTIPGKENVLDILINEILFNPRSNSPRFVEIYNHSAKFIDLKDWQLVGLTNSRVLTEDHFFMEPHSFLIITDDRVALSQQYPNARSNVFFVLSSMPSLPSTEGRVGLLSPQGIEIDSFSYTDGYHSPIIDNVKGISLERIKYDGVTNSSDNWFSASATEYSATPGYENSQSRPTSLQTKEVSIEPEVFAPESINRANYTTVNYSFNTHGNTLNVSIIDSEGRVIKELGQNILAGKNGFLTWDGTTDQLIKARVGYYMVLMEIISPGGDVRFARNKVVIGTEF